MELIIIAIVIVSFLIYEYRRDRAGVDIKNSFCSLHCNWCDECKDNAICINFDCKTCYYCASDKNINK